MRSEYAWPSCVKSTVTEGRASGMSQGARSASGLLVA
ncbi:Uncharacterised protein [Bordetella pertussis]|nr:Uncharacterised protein [Bordetella pertussis]CFP71390.1 Uncharacterised protein [Bordetella pertussis]